MVVADTVVAMGEDMVGSMVEDMEADFMEAGMEVDSMGAGLAGDSTVEDMEADIVGSTVADMVEDSTGVTVAFMGFMEADSTVEGFTAGSKEAFLGHSMEAFRLTAVL